jgi:signal transduction histidine kinase
MELGSLRFRLIASWLVFILLTLNLAGLGLVFLFERGMTRKMLMELELDLQLLARGLSVDSTGAVILSDVPGDPEFVVAYSGRYWQIFQGNKSALRSPSLWAQDLPRSSHPSAKDELVKVRLAGPDDQDLLGLVKTVAAQDGDKWTEFEIIVAVDYAEILASTRKFAYELWIGLGGLALLLLLAAWAHVSVGLKPLNELRTCLTAVRNGEARRLTGAFPHEIMALVAETNALLDAQDEALMVARTRSENLAHGLKTPLAVMAAQSRSLRRKGDLEAANEIDRQVEAMRRHVERELALARARLGGGTLHSRIDAAAALAEIARALKLLPKGQELDWCLAVAAPLMLPIQRSDFDDIMGNLLDNGRKWARTCIRVAARFAGNDVVLSVEDDGPGVPDDQLERIIQRGERAETSVPGSGLGLAIVSDLVAVYRGRLEIARSSLGGLKVAVVLPAA